jgi:hypothetical protein
LFLKFGEQGYAGVVPEGGEWCLIVVYGDARRDKMPAPPAQKLDLRKSNCHANLSREFFMISLLDK